MTKTQWKDAFRNIGKQLVSFISVIVIAMLAVLIYLGINYAASAMDRNVSAYYTDRNEQDLQVISPLLLTEEDLQAIRALDGVTDAEGSDQTTAWLRTEEQNYELSVISLPERIAVPEIVEGSAPQSAQECMLEQKLAEKAGLQVGDRIHLTGTAPDSAPLMMAETEFTVTGLFSHPDHITDNVDYNHYVIVTEEAFDQSTLEGNWLRVRVTLSDLPDNRFSKDYWKAVSPVEEALKALSAERSSLRYEEVYETYEKKISDGEAELEDAKAQLEDADRQLQEAEAEILDAEEQLQDGEKQIADAEAQIADGEKQIADAEAQIADGEKQIADAEAQIADGEKQLQDGEKQLQENEQKLRDGEQQLRDAEEQLRDAEAQIADGEKQLQDGEQKLQDAEAQIADGEKQLQDGEQQLRDGEQKLRDAEQQLRDGEQKLRDAETQIADGEKQLQDGEQKLQDGEKQLKDSEQQLRDGEKQIADGEKQLQDGEQRLQDGEKQIADGEKQLQDGEKKLADAEAQLRDAEAQLADGEKQLQEAEAAAADSMEELEKGKEQLAEAERLLGLAPGQLAEGEAKLNAAEEQLAEGKEKLDAGLAKLETAEDYIYKGYDWMVKEGYVPTPSDMAEAKEIAKELGVDLSSFPDAFPDNFLDMPKDKAIKWIEDNFGYSSAARYYQNELKRYRDGLAAYEQGREDYYYSGEQYLDGLTAYEKGKKAIEEAEAQLQALYDARDLLEQKKQELEAGREEFEAGRKELEARRAELEEGKKELEAGREELEAKRAELEEGKKEYEAGREEYEAGKKELEAGREELEAKKAELEEGKKEYEAGKEELEAGRKELEAGREELEAKKAEWEAGKEELEAGKKELEAGKEELEAKRAELEEGKKEYEAGKEEYEAGKKELEAGREEFEAKKAEWEAGKEELEAGKEELEAKRAELEEGKKELEAGREELESGKKELEEKRAELLDAKQRIADARAELAEKKQEYENGLQDYEDYRTRLNSARDELEQLKENAWIVMNNRADIGYVFCQENSGNLASLSGTFALLFIIIAALVIYASVGRMVDEQAVLVGTTKALGLYNREVLLKYMVFGVLGTMAGVLLGILLAWCLLQPLILHMYAPYYNITEASKCFLLGPSLIVVLGGLALSIIAVWLACNRLLKRTAMQLMKGEDPVKPKKGKKSNKSSGSLYTRLIILNMTSDLKRVIVTIVSIAGCCMLLLIGFMLKNGQDAIVDKQYGEVQTFDAELRFDPSAEDTEKTFSRILDEFGADYIPICRGDHLFSYGDNLSATRLVVVEADSLPGFYNLYDAKSGEELSPPEHGILIPKRLHEDFDIQPGTVLTLYDNSMQQQETEVAGIFNAYCERLFFLSNEAYREIFTKRPVPNSFYVKLNGRDISELTKAVRDTEGFLTVSDSTIKRSQLEATSAALNVLIIVMIVIAGLMAFFILVNLSGSYMIHKQKELTIMRINGFTVKECTRYASTELIVTTIVGILLGLLVGSPLGYSIQEMMEASDVQLVRGVDIWSLLLSALITALFSLIINSLALRRVKTLKLSDI